MARGEDERCRREISRLLADGLATQTEPFPETEKEFAELLDALRGRKGGGPDLRAKLVLCGLIDKPYGEDRMRCQECLYYLVHRRWCDLPELAIPVDPDWWCRLWRI
ncbi:hypothetical protein [Frateuria defendens]|uniref:hypothetical protein n=1 Tax=Frateuria defendens TaxID=2219559 RepID=UPI00066FB903|nr:hypothetical protein [Frateuria defendens]